MLLSACTVEEGDRGCAGGQAAAGGRFPAERAGAVRILALEQAEREEVSLLAYRDEGLFCGFAFMIEGADLAYVLFLAVDQAAQVARLWSPHAPRISGRRFPGQDRHA